MNSRPFLLVTLLLRNSLLVMLVPAFLYTSVQAAPYSNNTRIALSLMDFGYQEFDDNNASLNREDGYLPGLTLSVDAPASRWSLTTELSLYAKDVLYDGQTQSGTPIQSRTDETIVDVSLMLSKELVDKSLSPEQLYYGLGYRHWRRNIRDTRTAAGTPVSGLLEIYRIPYVLLGSRWDMARSNNTKWTLDLRLTHTFLSEMSVELYEGTTLDLGERVGGRVSITVDYLSPKGRTFYVEPFYEYWQLGKSGIEFNSGLGNILEPRSTTKNLGLNIGMHW